MGVRGGCRGRSRKKSKRGRVIKLIYPLNERKSLQKVLSVACDFIPAKVILLELALKVQEVL